MSDDKIAKTLNLQPIENDTYAIVEAPKEDAQSYDLETARQNVHALLQKGSVALDDLMNVAAQSQHPRSYEALTNLIKTLSDVNKDLVDLQEKKKKLSIPDEKENPTTVNNNLNFYGSTAEFQKMIKDMKDKSNV